MRRNAIHKSLPAALSDLDLDQLCRGSRQGSVGEAQGQVITACAGLASAMGSSRQHFQDMRERTTGGVPRRFHPAIRLSASAAHLIDLVVEFAVHDVVL